MFRRNTHLRETLRLSVPSISKSIDLPLRKGAGDVRRVSDTQYWSRYRTSENLDVTNECRCIFLDNGGSITLCA